MNKKLIWVVIIIAILIAGFFIFKPNYKTPKTESAQQTTTQTNTQPNTESSVQVKEITIEGTEFSFNPSSISLNQGETIRITFKNIGKVNHNFGIQELNIRTKTISPGSSDTIEFVANQTGIFEFDCSIAGHKESGMLGSLNIS